MYMTIVPLFNQVSYIAKIILVVALMEKVTSRMIVTRFSVSQSVSFMTLIVIMPYPLNRALGLGGVECLRVFKQCFKREDA